MELVNVLLCCKKKNANGDDDVDDSDVNNNTWGQFVLTRRHPEQVMSRIRLMRYPHPSTRDDRLLALTTHAHGSSDDEDKKRETSV